jgi:Lon protease-like protein
VAKICIFPIPGCVTFPGTVFPLHVFEPRYRAMIQHCLETETLLAICHTEKQLSPGKQAESLEQALSSNQATYRPYDVFSAGRCELLETMEDGRLLLNVHILQRYRLDKQLQQLPYQIYECTEFSDQPLSDSETRDCAELRDKILHRLVALGHGDPTIRKSVKQLAESEEWQKKTDGQFSLALFGVVHFEPELMQKILEMESAPQRLAYTLELLNDL